MAVKLFILGLPGSGKSTISQYITDYASPRQWSTNHFYDYDILYEMFQEDTQGQFRPADDTYGGFDVLDLTVLDVALKKLEEKVNAHIYMAQLLEEIVLIEFSRNNYEKAFQQFDIEFLQNAYFLYLNVDLVTCKKRIRERIAHPSTSHDHIASEYIFEKYYTGDDGTDLPQILSRNLRIDNERVSVVNNNGSPEVISTLIDHLVETIFSLKIYRLQETEPIQKLTDIEAHGELERN